MSCLSIGLVSYVISKSTIEKANFQKLRSIRQAKGDQIEKYLNNIRKQVLSLSENRMIINAMLDLRNAFNKVPEEFPLSSINKDQIESSLNKFYQFEFLPELQKRSVENPKITSFLPDNDAQKFLQYEYISNNQFPRGQKDKLDRSASKLSYNKAHDKYHPVIKNYLKRFGFYDIFLVDVVSGRVVYSVFKEVDFGTSLITGPYKKSNFAKSFLAAKASTGGSFTKLEDFKTLPSLIQCSCIFHLGTNL